MPGTFSPKNEPHPDPSPSRFPPATPWAVWTQHNDSQRTGANLDETSLTANNVKGRDSSGCFSPLPVSDEIYAQPLYVADQNHRLAQV